MRKIFFKKFPCGGELNQRINVPFLLDLIRYCIWYKVGKSLELGNYRDVFFRIDGDIDRVERSVKWYVWKINEPFIYVGKLPAKYYDAEDGNVMPYKEIVTRLKTGKYAYFFPAY